MLLAFGFCWKEDFIWLFFCLKPKLLNINLSKTGSQKFCIKINSHQFDLNFFLVLSFSSLSMTSLRNWFDQILFLRNLSLETTKDPPLRKRMKWNNLFEFFQSKVFLRSFRLYLFHFAFQGRIVSNWKS